MENKNYGSLTTEPGGNEYTLSDGTDLTPFLDDDGKAPLDGLFDDDEENGFRKILYSSVVVLTIGSFSVLAWYAYKFSSRPVDVEQLRLVKADDTSYKIKPENPGGMEVPYMDKTVYDSISSEKKTLPKVERILPSPEEPADLRKEKYNAVVEKAKQESAPKEIEQKPEEVVKKPDETVKKTSSFAAFFSSDEKPKPATGADLKHVPETNKTRQEAIAVSQPVTSRYRIQLGAYRTEKIAVDDWKRLQKKYVTELASLHYYIERKDLGEKGIFYRLQAGPLESAASARLACKQLVEQKQGCFFVEAK